MPCFPVLSGSRVSKIVCFHIFGDPQPLRPTQVAKFISSSHVFVSILYFILVPKSMSSLLHTKDVLNHVQEADGRVYFVSLTNSFRDTHHGKVLGLGPNWARAQFGPGSHLGPDPIWAWVKFGPEPNFCLGPIWDWAQVPL